MKPISDWTRDDLVQLVDAGEQESTTLEYKASDALYRGCRTELSKDVSAMANASGGLIVFGIAEKDHKPTGVDAGVSDPTITPEWIENVLTSNIRPPIPDVRIKAIRLDQGTAFVIHVPQAATFAPHQAQDNKYYRRRNFKCEPMEDAEVRDVMRRSNVSHPVISFTFCNLEYTPNAIGGELRTLVTNLTEEPVLYSTINLFFDREFFEDLNAQNLDHWTRSEGGLTMGAQNIPSVVYHKNFMVPGHMPFFNGQAFQVFSQRFVILRPDVWYPLGYRIACPGFSAEVGGSVRYHNGTIERESSTPFAVEVFGHRSP